MGKLIGVTLANWLVIALFGAQLIDCQKSAESAYRELFEKNTKLDRDQVQRRLSYIKGSKYEGQALRLDYNVGEMVKYNDINEGRCTMAIMRPFKAEYERLKSGPRYVDKYVKETYEKQMKACVQATKDAVKKHKGANSARWKEFKVFYNEMKRRNKVYTTSPVQWDGREFEMKNAMGNRLMEIAVIESKKMNKDKKKGSRVYDALLSTPENCREYIKNRLGELLEIQLKLNYADAHNDEKLVEYLRYYNLCQEAANVRDWGRASADAIVEEIIRGWTKFWNNVEPYANANLDATVQSYKHSAFDYAGQEAGYDYEPRYVAGRPNVDMYGTPIYEY